MITTCYILYYIAIYFIIYKYIYFQVYFNIFKENSHIRTISKVPAEIFHLFILCRFLSQMTALLTSYLL